MAPASVRKEQHVLKAHLWYRNHLRTKITKQPRRPLLCSPAAARTPSRFRWPGRTAPLTISWTAPWRRASLWVVGLRSRTRNRPPPPPRLRSCLSSSRARSSTHSEKSIWDDFARQGAWFFRYHGALFILNLRFIGTVNFAPSLEQR